MCGRGSPNWTARSRPTRTWRGCRAGSCSASTTAAATSPAWAPTSVRTCSPTGARCCWPAATPVSGSSPARWCRRWSTVARRFVEIRGKAWRIAELDDPRRLVSDFEATAPAGTTYPPVLRPPVGWIPQDDGRVALGAAVPLGVLAARQAEFVAAIDAPVVITPWRSLLVCDLAEGVADRRCGCWPRWGWCSTRTPRGWTSAPASAVPGASSRWPTCAPRPPGWRSRQDVARARALRRLRTGVRQPADGSGAGGHGGGVPAGTRQVVG